MEKKFLILCLLASVIAVSCKKEDVIAISQKQKELLGKWEQKEVYSPSNYDTNILTPCELENNTIFEFRIDGRCYISNSGNCVPNRDNPYAFSTDGSLLVIEGILYYVKRLTADELEFYSEPDESGFKQIWKKKQ